MKKNRKMIIIEARIVLTSRRRKGVFFWTHGVLLRSYTGHMCFMYTSAYMIHFKKIFNEHVWYIILTRAMSLAIVLEEIALLYFKTYWELVNNCMLVVEDNCLSNRNKIRKPSWSS